MTESAHTPGPWTVCGDGKCSCKTIHCGDFPIAQVTHGPWGDDYPAIRLVGTCSLDMKAEAYMEQFAYGEVSEPLARANARLIAATPDLASAAQQAWGALSWIIAYDSEDKTLARAIAALEAAIEKAGTFDFAAMRAKVEADRIAFVKTIAKATP